MQSSATSPNTMNKYQASKHGKSRTGMGSDASNWRTGSPLSLRVSDIQPILRLADGRRVPLQQCGASEFIFDEAYNLGLAAEPTRRNSEQSPVYVQDHEDVFVEGHSSCVSPEPSTRTTNPDDFEREVGRLTPLPDETSEVTLCTSSARDEPDTMPTAAVTASATTPATTAEPKQLYQAPRPAQPEPSPKTAYKFYLCDNEPDLTKKEYCAYWIRKGECDYTQQGCKFKHEMPDVKTLRRIGFLCVPAWYKQHRPRYGNWKRKNIMHMTASEGESDGDDEREYLEIPAAVLARKMLGPNPPTLDGVTTNIPMTAPMRRASIVSLDNTPLIDLGPILQPIKATLPPPVVQNSAAMVARAVPAGRPSTTGLGSPAPLSSRDIRPDYKYFFGTSNSPKQPAPNTPHIANISADGRLGSLTDAEKAEILHHEQESLKVLASPIRSSLTPPSSKTLKKTSTLNASPIAGNPLAFVTTSKTLADSRWAKHPATILAAAGRIPLAKDGSVLPSPGKPQSPPSPTARRHHRQNLMRARRGSKSAASPTSLTAQLATVQSAVKDKGRDTEAKVKTKLFPAAAIVAAAATPVAIASKPAAKTVSA